MMLVIAVLTHLDDSVLMYSYEPMSLPGSLIGGTSDHWVDLRLENITHYEILVHQFKYY